MPRKGTSQVSVFSFVNVEDYPEGHLTIDQFTQKLRDKFKTTTTGQDICKNYATSLMRLQRLPRWMGGNLLTTVRYQGQVMTKIEQTAFGFEDKRKPKNGRRSMKRNYSSKL